MATIQPIQNQAGNSKSPYIHRHRNSPVAWQLLHQNTVDRAISENKPIFLNIGSSPCHYAQLMTQDSWSRPAVASLLNEHYIPIMVDKDERPDLDSIYAHYLMSIHGKAGYPMNLFLTPKLYPIYGDTFLDGPTDHGDDDEDNPNIIFILKRVEKHWREERERLFAEGQATFSQLKEILAEGTRSQPVEHNEMDSSHNNDTDIELEIMEEAYSGHSKLYDPINAGFLSVPTDPLNPTIIPKFSMVSRLDYLLRLSHLPSPVNAIVGDDECENATEMALATLRKMRDLTMHDHLGGGFHSSTQTRDWAFPLFDKMVGHNGQLLDLYLDAWLTISTAEDRKKVANVQEDIAQELWHNNDAYGKNEFLDVVASLANYLTSPPICRELGGFCTSEAADSSTVRSGTSGENQHLRAGAYYVWSKKDFLSAISAEASCSTNAGELAAEFFNVKESGNIDRVLDPRDEFIVENVLGCFYATGASSKKELQRLSGRYGFSSPEHVRKELLQAKEALRKHREKYRTRPVTDTRVIASENGKVIGALARTGGALLAIGTEESSSSAVSKLGKECINAAAKAAAFIKANMWNSETKILYRIYDDEKQDLRAFAEDYAFLIDGLLHLYEVTSEFKWLAWADELQKSQIQLFNDMRTSAQPPTETAARCGGFYSTEMPTDGSIHPHSHTHAIIRAKSAMDDVSPSVNGVSVSNLLRLASLLADEEYRRQARQTILAFEVEVPQHPGLFTSLLLGLVGLKVGGDGSWVIISEGDEGRSNEALIRKYHSLPRAGLRSLVKLEPVKDDSDEKEKKKWFFWRNEKIRDLQGNSGVHRFDEKEGQYRRATDEEIKVLESVSARNVWK